MAKILHRLLLWLCLLAVVVAGARHGARRRINLRYPASILEKLAVDGFLEPEVSNDDVYPTVLDNVTTTVVESVSQARSRIGAALASSRTLREGVSGAAASAVQVATLMWLRTTSSYQAKYDVAFTDALQQLYADGGVARFYRGLPMALLQGPLSRAGSVSANALAETMLAEGGAGGVQTKARELIEQACRGVVLATEAALKDMGSLLVEAVNRTTGADAATKARFAVDDAAVRVVAARDAGGALVSDMLQRMPSLPTQYMSLSLSPAALGSVLSGLWRVILMPLDTIKTVQQVEGTKGFQNLMQRVLVGGEVGLLFQGTVTTMLAAASGHYPWFYVYTTLNELLRKPGESPHPHAQAQAQAAAGTPATADGNSTSTVTAASSAVSATSAYLQNVWIRFRDSELWDNKLVRSAFIGFSASTASDIASNVFRVLKTLKQTQAVGSQSLPRHRPPISLSGEGQRQAKAMSRHGSIRATRALSTDGATGSYLDIAQAAAQRPGGLVGLFTRGLLGRILSNGLQSILFTVLWREMAAALANAFPETPPTTTPPLASHEQSSEVGVGEGASVNASGSANH